MDYSKKENWTVEQLEKVLEHYTFVKPEERGNFDLLWEAKLKCEETMGIQIRPWREIMTKEELDEEGLAYAKATLEIEGRTLTPEAEELVRRCLRGEITHEEFLRLAKEQAVSQSRKSGEFISSIDLDKVLEDATRTAREQAFAAGLYASYIRNDKLLREYPDGTIKEVVNDQSGKPVEFDYTGE